MFANYRATEILGTQSRTGSFTCCLRPGHGRPLLDSRGGRSLQVWLWFLDAAPGTPAPHSQHIVPKAALPLSLVEEVVEVAAEGDEHKAKGQEAKNACGGPGAGWGVTNPRFGRRVFAPLEHERQLSLE